MTWRRIIASALVYGAIIAGIYYHRHPVRLGPPREPEQRATGYGPTGGRASAALLLPARTGEAANWADFSPDAVWGNFLRQEVGAFEVLDPARIGAEELSGLALIVVPEGVRPEEGEPLHDALDAWVRQGGILIVDGGVLGGYVEPSQRHSAIGRIRGLRAGLVDSLTQREIEKIPLHLPGFFRSSAVTAEIAGFAHLVGARVDSLPVNGKTLIATVSRGAGGIVVLNFGFARHLLTWQQGLPAADLGLPGRWRKEAGVTLRQTNELVAESSFLATEFPHADAFERLIMACAETIHPLPRLWYFPADYDGAFCMSHDDEDFGDRSRALTEEQRRQGYGSTMFIIPRKITAAGVAGMHADGAEIALHWWRGWSSSMERKIGVLGWTPLRQTRTLSEQKTILEGLSPGQTVTANRVHGLIWASHYTRDFRRLEAAGFTLDSSYGPAGPAQIGYLFGTGFPFHPLDTNGLPFRLEEMPFLYQDDENWDPGLDDRLLGASRDSWHQVVTPLYHTTTMYWNPSVAVMEGFLSAASRARAANHWVVPMGGYHAFWRRRGDTAVRRLPGEGGFESAAPVDSTLALMVPRGWRIVPLAGAGGDSLSSAPAVLRRVNVMGGAYDLVPLDRIGPAFRYERVEEAVR